MRCVRVVVLAERTEKEEEKNLAASLGRCLVKTHIYRGILTPRNRDEYIDPARCFTWIFFGREFSKKLDTQT